MIFMHPRFSIILLFVGLWLVVGCASTIQTKPEASANTQGQTTAQSNTQANPPVSAKSPVDRPESVATNNERSIAEDNYGDVTEDEWDEGNGQGSATNQTAIAQKVADPLEPFNRAMFILNDKLYFWALKPVAQGYGFVTPDSLQRGIKNFFYNLVFPVRVSNNLFQGKLLNVARETDRFIINTCFGGLGLADLAGRHPELTIPAEDAGQTLGKYGIGNGFYIVWPLLGPSTLRDSVGLAVDSRLTPLTYIQPLEMTVGARGLDLVNKTSLSIGEYEAIKKSSIDPYTAIKDGYLQYRQSQIKK